MLSNRPQGEVPLFTFYVMVITAERICSIRSLLINLVIPPSLKSHVSFLLVFQLGSLSQLFRAGSPSSKLEFYSVIALYCFKYLSGG